jgi:hypothetical protein
VAQITNEVLVKSIKQLGRSLGAPTTVTYQPLVTIPEKSVYILPAGKHPILATQVYNY